MPGRESGLLFLVALAFVEGVTAQATASLSGSVRDAATASPLIGATVQVFVADTNYGTVTDTSGLFRFDALPTGIHRVRTDYVGFATMEVSEVWVRLGKEEHIEFALERSSSDLGEVEIRGVAPQRLNTMSAHTLTVEQTLRYPATFFDPARLATSYAGVASTNDQANHFSVRGNGPSNNAWLLEGAEIVTPNHLTNAGTQSDYPTLSGGGTTILSAQMLGTSQLLMGGMSASYGNALGGIMDLQLRPGINSRHAFTGQAGLIGIDLSAEGPFRIGGRASYLVNYRYSTLGLLSAMGVALGDEKITFQDLSFNVSIPIRRSVLTVFGMGGNSSSRFAAKDSSEWEFDKDSQNIDYMAKVGAAGMTFGTPLGNHAVWNTTAVISANDQERVSEEFMPPRRGFIFGKVINRLNEQKVSFVSHVNGAVGARLTYRIGGSAMQRTVTKDLGISESVEAWLIRPFAQCGWSLTEHVKVEAGVAYAHYTFNGSGLLEPRLALSILFRKGRTIRLSAGQRGQLPLVQNFPVTGYFGSQGNDQVGMTSAQEIVLGYDHPFKSLVLHVEAYVQHQQHVPWGENSFAGTRYPQIVSLVNAWDNYYLLPFTGRGNAWNKGVEFSLHRPFENGAFYQVNGTVLDAYYFDEIGGPHDSRWNTGVVGNAVMGWEFVKERETVKRTWGVNGRINFTGGQHYTPSTTPEILHPEAYSAQYNSTYRLDLRVYLKRERKSRTGMWSLDLLNATNAQNVAYDYFDQRKGEVVTKYQLGLIPNLSYRIEF